MESSTRALIEKRLKEYEVGSVQHDHYMQILREMDVKKLHVAEESTCDGCA
jgi:hypothetical protein